MVRRWGEASLWRSAACRASSAAACKRPARGGRIRIERSSQAEPAAAAAASPGGAPRLSHTPRRCSGLHRPPPPRLRARRARERSSKQLQGARLKLAQDHGEAAQSDSCAHLVSSHLVAPLLIPTGKTNCVPCRCPSPPTPCCSVVVVPSAVSTTPAGGAPPAGRLAGGQ